MNRKTWKYRDCTINPVLHEPLYFGCANFKPDASCPQYYTRSWKIIFPDGTWTHCATKADVRDYINMFGIGIH